MVPVKMPQVPEGDEELLARLATGERAVLDVLFTRHRETAYRVAYRLLGNPEDALDAVQEGFIKAMKHVQGFEARCSFKTWLLRIVSNAALDLGRQRRRRETLREVVAEQVTQTGGCTPAHADPARETEENDLREALNEALLQLPESQRRTFVLHVDGGLCYREIADLMEISIGTVMSRLYYARQKLKHLLAARVPE